MKHRRRIAYYGKRVKRGRAAPSRKGRKPAAPSKAKDRRLAQLVIAGTLFVLLVLCKLLSPQSVGALADSLRQGLGQDADFKAAFSAVGEAIAGERAVGDSLEEAYTAVFAPDTYHAERAAAVSAAADWIDEPAKRLRLRMQDGGEETAESEDETAQLQSLTEHPLIYFGAPAPTNVSFEQVALGFSYTTPTMGTMTSCFGYREHPIAGEERFHYGLDIAAAKGTEICAFADGRVKVTGESSSLGKYLMLSHDGGFTTLYAHCDKITARSGQQVSMGEKIAEMGKSGAATGTHLHFELLQGNTYLNPIYYVEVY